MSTPSTPPPARPGIRGSSLSNTPRPRRTLALVLFVVTGLYLAVTLGPRHTPRLGLDLRGGTSAVLTARAPGGHAPTAAALGQTVNILRNRLSGNGVAAADVTTEGSDQIVVEVPGSNGQQLVAELLRSAQLRFRLVREIAPAVPAPETSKPVPQIEFGPTASTASVQDGFDALTCAPNATSASTGLDQSGDVILACSQDGKSKFVLAPASVAGKDVSSATATVDSLGAWQVALDFNASGTRDWSHLTNTAWQAPSPASCTGTLQTGCNAIAVVLDGVVQSYPTVDNGPITNGQTVITGNFTEGQAKTLANVLKYGALPVHLTPATTQTVSPTLGSEQLRGGLLAGAIGLGLVLAYLILYYRRLAPVAIASLALSAAVLYASVTLLGQLMGYTLTLAGIAGFIVAIGITADSFVVLFERLRDELRAGRTLRSGVHRAWPRARRTITSADAVSLLAAATLYLVSIGDVRGFAFTLGLSTICDLFIVFAFTYPAMTALAGTKWFRPSGLRRREPQPRIQPAGPTTTASTT